MSQQGKGDILTSGSAWVSYVGTSIVIEDLNNFLWFGNTTCLLTGCEIVLGIFFWAGLGIFFGFLGWYHLPSVCNGLELEFVILHGICHIWACSPSILHGIYYMWACSPSILYGICHILACSPSILHGMFYMWACSPKYLQMRKLGIR